jgi:hypothetical protein
VKTPVTATYDDEGSIENAVIRAKVVEIVRDAKGFYLRMADVPAVIRFDAETPIRCTIGLKEEVLITES